MIKIIIKSYQVRGWIADFYGDASRKLQNYCNDKKNDEDIEYLIGGSNEEDLI